MISSLPGCPNVAPSRRGVQPRRFGNRPPAAKIGGIWESRTDLIDEWRRRRTEGHGVDEVAGLGKRLARRA